MNRSMFLFSLSILCIASLAMAQTAFVVQSNQQWQNTGISVAAGDKLVVIGRGVWNYGGASSCSSCWKVPDGTPSAGVVPGTLVPTVTAYCLVGKIGINGRGFAIGSYSNFTADSSGSLYLAVNDDGFGDNTGYLIAIIIKNTLTSAVSDENPEFPNHIGLGQNYPNPFNPSTTFEYTLNQRGHVRVQVFDNLGRLVSVLQDAVQESGNYRLTWDGKTSSGLQAATGTYFYQLSVDGNVATKKMLLLK